MTLEKSLDLFVPHSTQLENWVKPGLQKAPNAVVKLTLSEYRKHGVQVTIVSDRCSNVLIC